MSTPNGFGAGLWAPWELSRRVYTIENLQSHSLVAPRKDGLTVLLLIISVHMLNTVECISLIFALVSLIVCLLGGYR